MTIYQYGEQAAENVLIQLVGEHDLPTVEDEVREIQKMTERPFSLIAAKVDTWNQELTPWKAPAVYGTEEFGDGAAQTLEEIKKLCVDKSKTYYIGGYSLAGLFSLWAAYQTNLFAGVAAASPSVWFPGFIPYMRRKKRPKIRLWRRWEPVSGQAMHICRRVGICVRWNGIRADILRILYYEWQRHLHG